MDKILIDNSKIRTEFNTHLRERYNKRVLLSAPFGAGKSYFINEFFKRNPNYLSITLFPVDYSVSSNEDIFEIIKYDIIDSLFENYAKYLDLIVNDFSNLLIAQSFVANKLDILPLIKSLVKNTNIGAEELISFIESIKKIVSKFNEYKTDLSADERKLLSNYMGVLENKKGSIRENDEITNLIKDFLDRIKKKRKNKQFVLVIDDLDRLDPEQIFRLFNIFTAHHDSRKDVNKFGFDKVIFVCDLNNIEYMFRHKYGSKFNFDGYIDKFYSYKPFFFDHKKFLKEKASTYFVNSLNLGMEYKNFSDESFLGKLFGQKGDFFDLMVNLSHKMVDDELLRTRNFQKFKSFYLPVYKIKIGHREYDSYQFPLLIMCALMKQFHPRIEDFLSAVRSLKDNFEANYEVKSNTNSWIWENLLISYSIPFFIENFSETDHRHSTPYFVPVKNEFDEKLYLEYQVKEDWQYRYKQYYFIKAVKTNTVVNETSSDSPMSKPNPYHFLELALRQCLKHNFIWN